MLTISLLLHRSIIIFITDIFRPKIKCTTLFGGLLCLCEVSRLGLERGRETIFGGLPCRRFLSPRVSPSRAPVFSCAHYLQAPATQAMWYLCQISHSLHVKVRSPNCSDHCMFTCYRLGSECQQGGAFARSNLCAAQRAVSNC